MSGWFQTERDKQIRSVRAEERKAEAQERVAKSLERANTRKDWGPILSSLVAVVCVVLSVALNFRSETRLAKINQHYSAQTSFTLAQMTMNPAAVCKNLTNLARIGISPQWAAPEQCSPPTPPADYTQFLVTPGSSALVISPPGAISFPGLSNVMAETQAILNASNGLPSGSASITQISTQPATVPQISFTQLGASPALPLNQLALSPQIAR